MWLTAVTKPILAIFLKRFLTLVIQAAIALQQRELESIKEYEIAVTTTLVKTDNAHNP